MRYSKKRVPSVNLMRIRIKREKRINNKVAKGTLKSGFSPSEEGTDDVFWIHLIKPYP